VIAVPSGDEVKRRARFIWHAVRNERIANGLSVNCVEAQAEIAMEVAARSVSYFVAISNPPADAYRPPRPPAPSPDDMETAIGESNNVQLMGLAADASHDDSEEPIGADLFMSPP
jgi:hypothetical protein